MDKNLANFTDLLCDDEEIANSQPLSLTSSHESATEAQGFLASVRSRVENMNITRPPKRTGQHGDFRSVEEIDPKYRHIFSYPYFNLVQSSVIEDALYSDKSMVVCAPTGSGKTVVFEMAIVQLLMELEDKNYTGDFKIIYMAPVKALCAERLSEWYPKFTKLGLMCIEVTGDTDVDFSQLKPYRIIVTTPEKWDMLTRRWRDHRGLADVIKLFLIDEVHILNDATRGPVLEAVVSRMKTVEVSQQAAHRIEQLQKQYSESTTSSARPVVGSPPRIRFVAVSATVSNPEDVAAWLGTTEMPAVYCKFGDECRPVKLKRVVEGYPCSEGMSIFKFDIILNYKLWPIIQKYNDGKPTLIFCNTRKSVALTAETLSRELTINFTPEQKAKLTAVASIIKNKKLQTLVLSGVGCHHAGLLYEERLHIEEAFRNRDLPILITTTTLAMGVNLPAHLVIIKNTQQYVNGQYQEYSISTVLQMVGRAGRPQFDTEATAVIMTRLADKSRYQALVGGDEPLQSYLHKRLPENLNSEAALGTVGDVAQCVQWLRSTFLSVRAIKDPRRYLGIAPNAPPALISKKVEELCVKAMNGLASAGLITMDEASCIEATEAGRLMSVFYLDLETMKQIMKIEGNETLDKLLGIVCESHELSDMHLRVDERRTLNALNRNNAAATIRFPMKGKISTRQMKLNCIIQAVIGCLPIPDPSLNQEAMKIMRIADRICKCLVAYVTRPDLITAHPQYFSAVLNSVILAKCVAAHLWDNSPYVSKQLKGIGPTFSTLLASAGKINFTLLEESHPRDLERIMNKGAPAGNVLRKQVGLLPKYQLTASPLDESRVSVQLMLINQIHLAENREHLTAGGSHKCYIIAGDSENYLLFFTSFKDKDLIGIYDGIITLEITRKHGFQHTVFVHCISSNWVGVDVHCDYVFKSIEPSFICAEAIHPMPTDNIPTKTTKKQTSITNTFKARKRKSNEVDITQSKEKKKRETALIEKFKVLKNSFEETSKELKKGCSKSEMSNQLIQDIALGDIWGNTNTSLETAMGDIDDDFPTIEVDISNVKKNLKTVEHKEYDTYPQQDVEELNDEDTLIVDERIDSILNEIETEISKSKTVSNLSNRVQSSVFVKPPPKNINLLSTSNRFPNIYKYSANEGKKRKIANNKSNFSFLEAIEKNDNLNQSTDDIPRRDSGFSDTIKSQIKSFLQKASIMKNHADFDIYESLEPVENMHSDTREEPQPIKNDATNTLAVVNNKQTKELPAVYLNSEITIPNQLNHNPSHDRNSDNVQITQSEAGLDLYKEANSDINCNGNKTIIEPDKTAKTETYNNDYVGDTVDNIHAREFNPIIMAKDEYKCQNERPIVSHDIVLIDSVGNEINDYFANDIESEGLFIDDSKIETDRNTAICKSSKNDIVTEKEFQDHFEQDVQSVGQAIKRKKDYGKKILLDSTNFRQPDISLNGISLQTHNNNLHTIPQTGTKLALMYQSDVPECKTNVKTFKKPTFKPPLMQTPTIKVNNAFKKTVNKEQEISSNNQMGNSNSCSKPEQSTQKYVRETCERYPIANSSQEVSHTQMPQNRKECEAFEYYKSQYSFSATKIDVCTKNTSDHQVHIIRKVKLDLDVTEIISKVEENKGQTRTKHESSNINDNETQQPYNYTESIELPSTKANFGVVKEMRCIEMPSKKILPFYKNNEIESKVDNRRHTETKHKYLNRNETLKLLDNKILKNPDRELPSTEARFGVDKGIKSIADLKIDLSPVNIHHKYLRRDNFIEPECSESYQENVNESKIKDGDKEKKAKSTITNNPKDLNSNIHFDYKKIEPAPETKNNIGNILQKYSVLLRKSFSNNNSNVDIKISQDNIKQSTEKTKRTYKINDIHNLEIPLPKNLIAVEATRTPRSSNNGIISIKDVKPDTNNFKEMSMVNASKNNLNIRDLTPSKNISTTIIRTDALEQSKVTNSEPLIPPLPKGNEQFLDKTKNDFHEEISVCLSPVDDVPLIETLDEFNLDQALLNPKTLLQQCFSKDETIIPPPSGFCDNDGENTYSPTQLEEDYECLDFTRQEFNETQEDTTLDIPNRSIFEDNAHLGLTPYKEIETWTFSPDKDAVVDSHRFQIRKKVNPLKSYRVMRSNSPANEDLSLPQQADRTGKLGQFKFKHKKKLTL